ncbi:tropomyosin-like isoform X2 [Hemicordylus capensis]|nr:tropomyosin-like isoform X2 [Hemicordylus capensis]
MDKSAVSRLTETNENLKNEIWDLREMAANLDLEKQEIIIKNKSIKEQNKSLEAKIECFKAMAEDLHNEEEDLQVSLLQLEETLGQLESQNNILKGTNQMLNTEIQRVSSHVICFEDYKATQEQDISHMKQVMEHIVSYFKELEGKIETAQQRYIEEKNQVAELERTLEELEQIREVQENEIACLRDQLEEASLLRSEMDENVKTPSLLHEMVQAKLVQDSLAVQSSVLLFLSKFMWLLLAAALCLVFLSGSVKLYIFMFDEDLETGSRLLLFPDHQFKLLLDVFSPLNSRKPNGLLPF